MEKPECYCGVWGTREHEEVIVRTAREFVDGEWVDRIQVKVENCYSATSSLLSYDNARLLLKALNCMVKE